MPEVEDVKSVPLLDDSARSELEAKISDQFEKVFAEADADDEPSPEPKAKETSAKESVAEAADEEVGEVAEPSTPKEPEVEASEEAAASEAPILPAAYRRSLKNYEWTDEEINSALERGGDAFVATAAKLHATRNKETAEMAAAGRAARQAPPSQPHVPLIQPQRGLNPIDVKQLKEQYGDEALIDKLAGPLNATIAEINRIMPVIQSAQDRSRRVETETLGKQIDTFFGSAELKPYAETYGSKSETLTETQLAERNKVLELADAIVGGANMQRRSITLETALQMALDSVTSGTKEKAARDNLVKTLKTREKGITLRPSARAASIGAKKTPERSRADMEKDVKSRLTKIFAA